MDRDKAQNRCARPKTSPPHSGGPAGRVGGWNSDVGERQEFKGANRDPLVGLYTKWRMFLWTELSQGGRLAAAASRKFKKIAKISGGLVVTF